MPSLGEASLVPPATRRGSNPSAFSTSHAYQQRLQKTPPHVGASIAALALHLHSDEASLVTGSYYPLDGGAVNLH